MLEDRIRGRFKEHIKKGGLITDPEKLLTAILKTIDRWLRQQEKSIRSTGKLAEADTLRELCGTLLKNH